MLGDDAIARYARQIVVPGIGAVGQERLLATTVIVAGHPRGVAQATLYLEAAGVRVVGHERHELEDAQVAIVAGVDSIADPLLALLASCGKPVCWYRIDGDGFTSGVHPESPLPSSPSSPSCPACPASPASPAEWHDAAACDTAAIACAIILGLPHRRGPFHFQF